MLRYACRMTKLLRWSQRYAIPGGRRRPRKRGDEWVIRCSSPFTVPSLFAWVSRHSLLHRLIYHRVFLHDCNQRHPFQFVEEEWPMAHSRTSIAARVKCNVLSVGPSSSWADASPICAPPRRRRKRISQPRKEDSAFQWVSALGILPASLCVQWSEAIGIGQECVKRWRIGAIALLFASGVILWCGSCLR